MTDDRVFVYPEEALSLALLDQPLHQRAHRRGDGHREQACMPVHIDPGTSIRRR